MIYNDNNGTSYTTTGTGPATNGGSVTGGTGSGSFSGTMIGGVVVRN